MIKIITIIGARPQFIKAAAVSRIIRNDYSDKIEEILVHTGQHYDDNMSKVFFDELDIPHPKYNLEIAGNSHGAMTGRMLEAVEKILLHEKPTCVLIYGDTNSTLAGALAAAKLHIPIAHVEAGLRSFNMKMPEEINRVLADRVSSLLFCPTSTATQNLRNEGLTNGVHNVGDVMFDAAIFYGAQANIKSTVLSQLNLKTNNFALATCHRAENTDHPIRLKAILHGLVEISKRLPVVLPLHPRTKKLIDEYEFQHLLDNLTITSPLSFLDMVALEKASSVILTDSGGVQKEAFFYQVPCVTMRDETEWIETVETDWNHLVGADTEKIVQASLIPAPTTEPPKPFGDGHAALKIVSLLLRNLA